MWEMAELLHDIGCTEGIWKEKHKEQDRRNRNEFDSSSR